MIRTLCASLLISLTLFVSGCSLLKPVSIVEGTDDYIPIPKGTVIKAVPINITGTTESYDVVTQKEGAFYSVDAQAEVLQARRNK